MNEPAIFFSQKSVDKTAQMVKAMAEKEFTIDDFRELQGYLSSRQNCEEDYSGFYHNTPQGRYCHKDVHNLYGYNMTRSAAEGLAECTDTAVFSIGSDGTDGPTDAAGGYVDNTTKAVLNAQNIELYQVLADNDAYHALEKCNGLVITGATGTNVNDVAVLLIKR